MDEDRGGPRRVQAGHAVARGELVEGHRCGGTERRRRVRPQVGHRPVRAVRAVGEDRPDHREDHVDARSEQPDDQEGAHQVVAREAAQGCHVAQLVQRDGDRGHRELDVDEFEDAEADRAGGLDDPARHPRRVAQRVIGGRHVLVEHHRAGLRGDQQPGVAGLAAGHQQQGQSHALQQEETLPSGATRDGDDGPGQGHQQRAVAEHHLGADHPPHEPEDEVDADRGGEPDEALPPGEHDHHQRHAGVQHRPRLGAKITSRVWTVIGPGTPYWRAASSSATRNPRPITPTAAHSTTRGRGRAADLAPSPIRERTRDIEDVNFRPLIVVQREHCQTGHVNGVGRFD